ncbi:hypothetical protein HDF13_001019 [Edaphobacter lichenicola]|uniref:Uncharacterized protein n=1 Tax=Tunturiibacter gelidiferens TaxID=3069689 RepID=A0ACC5NVQ0_9BACT|nr:hypothetical protein [Edaphobacter lichenicola]
MMPIPKHTVTARPKKQIRTLPWPWGAGFLTDFVCVLTYKTAASGGNGLIRGWCSESKVHNRLNGVGGSRILPDDKEQATA